MRNHHSCSNSCSNLLTTGLQTYPVYSKYLATKAIFLKCKSDHSTSLFKFLHLLLTLIKPKFPSKDQDLPWPGPCPSLQPQLPKFPWDPATLRNHCCLFFLCSFSPSVIIAKTVPSVCSTLPSLAHQANFIPSFRTAQK